jgi:hypothetical protein
MNKERSGSHAQMKNLNHSVDIDPDSLSYMTFDNMKDAGKFATRQQELGYHIIEVKDDYRRT